VTSTVDVRDKLHGRMIADWISLSPRLDREEELLFNVDLSNMLRLNLFRTLDNDYRIMHLECTVNGMCLDLYLGDNRRGRAGNQWGFHWFQSGTMGLRQLLTHVCY